VNTIDFERQKFPFENEFFDLVVSEGTLEHINNQKLVLEEMCRVTKKNGMLFLSVVNGNKIAQLLDWYHSIDYNPFHIKPANIEDLINFFRKNNFKILEARTNQGIIDDIEKSWINPEIKKIIVNILYTLNLGGMIIIAARKLN